MSDVPQADLMELATQERTDLLDLLRTLTTEQWEAPSLCTEWTVREVVAHLLSYEDLAFLGTMRTFLRGGLRTGKVNDVALRPFRNSSPAELMNRLESHLRPHGLPAVGGGFIALADGVIHHQDIRRSLGIPRTVPSDRLRAALPIAAKAPTLPSKSNVKGLNLVASDVDWVHGEGPEIRGPGEAILMAMTGRPDALGDLTGPGVDELAARIS